MEWSLLVLTVYTKLMLDYQRAGSTIRNEFLHLLLTWNFSCPWLEMPGWGVILQDVDFISFLKGLPKSLWQNKQTFQNCIGLLWWLRWQSICLQCERPGFNTWVGKIPCRRKWQPTPGLLPGKSRGWRSLVSYSPCGRKESDTTEWLHFHFFS